MKIEELRDRKKFILMQESIISERLEGCIYANMPRFSKLSESLAGFDFQFTEIEEYVKYRCFNIQECSTNSILILFNNLVFSSTKINKEALNNLLKIKYIFYVLENRIKSDKFSVNVLVDINTGNIAFNKNNESLENIRVISENIKIESPPKTSLGKIKTLLFKSKEVKFDFFGFKKQGSLVYNTRNTVQCMNTKPISITSPFLLHKDPLSPTIEKYKSIFPTLEFININFHLKKYPICEYLFERPFSIFICISEMNNYINLNKIENILEKLENLKQMRVEELLYLSSVDYLNLYGYSELVSLSDLSDADYELYVKVELFLEEVEDMKYIPLLNFILNIAPGLIYSIDLRKYENYPYFHLLQWIS